MTPVTDPICCMDLGCAQSRTTISQTANKNRKVQDRCYLSISLALDEALQALLGSDNGDLERVKCIRIHSRTVLAAI